MRLPGLLDQNLNEVTRLHPASASATLKMVGSGEAALTLPEDSPAVYIHDWISIYTQRGFAGIFRVSNVAHNYTKQIDVTLLHGIDILSDSVWPEQREFSGSKRLFLETLLSKQTRLINGQRPWVLDRCEDTATVERSINYDRLSSLLEGLEEEGSDYYFTYDQTSFPWKLSYVSKGALPSCEFRLTRNIRSATVTYNDADLCTRLYLSVSSKHEDEETVKEKNPAYVDEETTPGVPPLIDKTITVTSSDNAVRTYNNTAAQAIWGIVVKTADIDTKDDIAAQHFTSADAWAANFLKLREEPSVQIQIDGDELAALTGDTWDELSIGKMCQVALPEYDHVFRERVVSVSYPELLKDPSRVSVSLANTLPKFTESIATAQKTASVAGSVARGVSRSAADAKEVTSWSQHVQYQGAALDGTGVLTLYEAGIDMDAAGGVKIFSLVEGVQALYSGITVNAGAIESLVTDTGNLSSRITQEANRISLVVEGSGESASIKIGSIVDGINSTDVQIDAKRIYLNGSVIATAIDAVSADLESLTSGSLKATSINSSSLTGDSVTGGTLYATNQLSIGKAATSTSGASGTLYFQGEQFYKQQLTMGTSSKTSTYFINAYVLGNSSSAQSLNHYHKIVASEGTGTNAGKIIIELTDPVSTSDSSNHTTNFKIADTTAYKEGVLSARNAVKVKPFTANALQTLTDHRTFTYTTDAPTPDSGTSQADTWYLAGGTSFGTDNKTTVYLRYNAANGTNYASLSVDASSVYNKGRAAVTLGDPYWNELTGDLGASRTLRVKTVGRTNTSGGADELTATANLALTGSGRTVYLRHGGSDGTAVAKYTCTDSNLIASNIRDGVTIFGVEGALSPKSIQNRRSTSYTSNGTKYLYPSSGYDGMYEAVIDIDVQSSISKNDIAISGLGTYSSKPSCDENRGMSSAYKYGKLTITVGNVSKTVCIEIQQA